MVVRVQRVGEEYRIVLSPEAIEALHLSDGAEVEIRRVEQEQLRVQYVTVQEALESYGRTESQHRNTYQELAK